MFPMASSTGDQASYANIHILLQIPCAIDHEQLQSSPDIVDGMEGRPGLLSPMRDQTDISSSFFETWGMPWPYFLRLETVSANEPTLNHGTAFPP